MTKKAVIIGLIALITFAILSLGEYCNRVVVTNVFDEMYLSICADKPAKYTQTSFKKLRYAHFDPPESNSGYPWIERMVYSMGQGDLTIVFYKNGRMEISTTVSENDGTLITYGILYTVPDKNASESFTYYAGEMDDCDLIEQTKSDLEEKVHSLVGDFIHEWIANNDGKTLFSEDNTGITRWKLQQ